MERRIPAYAAVYQESSFRFTDRAVRMIWGEEAPQFVRIDIDKPKGRLYFHTLTQIDDRSQVWNREGTNGHVFSRSAIKWARMQGDYRKRFPLQWDKDRGAYYVTVRRGEGK